MPKFYFLRCLLASLVFPLLKLYQRSSLIVLLFLFSVISLLTSCTTQLPNKALNQTFWNKQSQTVSVAIATKPKAQVHQEGSRGLIEIAINNSNNKNINASLNKISLASFDTLRKKFVRQLKARGISAVVYSSPIDLKALEATDLDNENYAIQNFTPLKTKLNGNELLLISITKIGVSRRYWGFIPLGTPKAICQLQGRLIRLSDNKILWRYQVSKVLPIVGKWDQFPHYTNVHAALRKVIKNAQEALLSNFFERGSHE